jgi:hypothetical protein
MSKGKVRYLAVIILVGFVIKLIFPVVSASESSQLEETVAAGQVRAITPLSMQMVNEAMAVLSEGWFGMGPAEQEVFLTIFDPALTGEIDEQFVWTVVSNYQRIRQSLENEIEVKYEPDDDRCEGRRLYYTDIISLHVCPYFLTETNDTRKARTLIHEFAHIALKVTDRPYYRPTSKSYAELTPRGSWASQLPIVGPVIREIVASDTLHHPDAYAHFALVTSGQASAREMFLNYGIGDMNQIQNGYLQEDGKTTQTIDSWSVAH